ncbi:hypothetical protein TYRP_021325 [Tyrophagus putrescentiae]|nr:hypothetical protein TYRP_021325 [Tyrophagus putrescentiae]
MSRLSDKLTILLPLTRRGRKFHKSVNTTSAVGGPKQKAPAPLVTEMTAHRCTQRRPASIAGKQSHGNGRGASGRASIARGMALRHRAQVDAHFKWSDGRGNAHLGAKISVQTGPGCAPDPKMKHFGVVNSKGSTITLSTSRWRQYSVI